MDNERFLIKAVTTSIVLIIASFSGCNVAISYDDNKAMRSMVENGADPIDARCAIKGSVESYCDIRAASKIKGE